MNLAPLLLCEEKIAVKINGADPNIFQWLNALIDRRLGTADPSKSQCHFSKDKFSSKWKWQRRILLIRAIAQSPYLANLGCPRIAQRQPSNHKSTLVYPNSQKSEKTREKAFQ